MIKLNQLKIPNILPNNKWVKIFLISFPLALILSLFVGFKIYFSNRIFPGIKISGIDVGAKTKEEALSLLRSQIILPEKINVIAKDKTFELSLPGVGFSFNLERSVMQAYITYRSQNLSENIINQILSPAANKNIALDVNFNEEKLQEYFQKR